MSISQLSDIQSLTAQQELNRGTDNLQSFYIPNGIDFGKDGVAYNFRFPCFVDSEKNTLTIGQVSTVLGGEYPNHAVTRISDTQLETFAYISDLEKFYSKAEVDAIVARLPNIVEIFNIEDLVANPSLLTDFIDNGTFDLRDSISFTSETGATTSINVNGVNYSITSGDSLTLMANGWRKVNVPDSQTPIVVELASETVAGIVKLASANEALTGVDVLKAITPATLKVVTDNVVATLTAIINAVDAKVTQVATDLANFATLVESNLGNQKIFVPIDSTAVSVNIDIVSEINSAGGNSSKYDTEDMQIVRVTNAGKYVTASGDFQMHPVGDTVTVFTKEYGGNLAIYLKPNNIF